jgi:SAM-dependent methyltransferase
VIPVENNYRVTSCPFCNSSSIKKTGDLNYAGKVEFSTHIIDLKFIPEIWKCGDCGSSFTQNAIKPDVAEDLYATGEGSKRWSAVNFSDDKTKVVRDCLDKYISKKNISVLDVGCNTGEFLDYAKEAGAKTYGLELCQQSCDIVNGKGHIAYRTGEEIIGKFNLVTGFDVFEHLYDPNGFLSFIHGILNEDGIFILLTGNPHSLPAGWSKENWWYFNYPEHVIFPAPAFFEKVKGFKVLGNVDVFASISHEGSGLILSIKNFFGRIFNSGYSGRPATIPDHQLVVLQKV